MFSKLRFTRKGNLKKCTSFEELKGTRYFQGNSYFGIIVFSCLSSTNLCLEFLLICFTWEIKGFYQSSRVCRNILAKNQNFKKLRHSFVDEKAMITMTLWFSCHWKMLVPFCLWKKRPEKEFLTVTVNYCKIVQKNKLYHSKKNWLLWLKNWCFSTNMGLLYP